jgi:hypothetical protein
MNGPTLYRCCATTESDIQALAEFLRTATRPEEELHRLLEATPGVVGALGFCEFVSEFPLIKRDEVDTLAEKRRCDRADLLAARETGLVARSGAPFKSAHVTSSNGDDRRDVIANVLKGVDMSDRQKRITNERKI